MQGGESSRRSKKEINVEKIIAGLKNKIKKERKKKEEERKKKEENSTELQKPNVEAEVYNNNKNVREKKLKSLIRFHSASKINNCNGAGWRRGEKRKNLKESTEQVKTKNKCFSWVTAVSVLSLTGSHSPPHLPRMLSNTVLISAPAVGAAQMLI